MCFIFNTFAYGFPYNFVVSKLSKLCVLSSCKVVTEHKCDGKYWINAKCYCLIWPAHKGFRSIGEKTMIV